MKDIFPTIQDESNTKSKIFMEAARLFASKGYNGVSMREISERTGLSKPTIYYYFGNKEGIYTSLIHVGLSQGTSQFEKILQKPIPVKDKLVEAVKVRFRQTLNYPEFVKFFLILFISTEKLPFLDSFIKEATKHRQVMVNLIKEGIKRGEFGASANPQLASEIIIGAITHFIWKQLNQTKRILSDKLAEEIVELLFKGLNE
jgi:TetR/AcrR family transcriptional regulator